MGPPFLVHNEGRLLMEKFNLRQKDAFAKILDNIGTANLIAILVGIFVESKITLLNGSILGTVSVLCFFCAAFLRKGDE